jgi:hypothetical protein
MSKLRIAFVSGLLFLLIASHLYEIGKDHENWPVCSYPMYSWLESEPAVVSFRLVGVLPDGSETPFQANPLMYPFDQSRMADGLVLINKEQDAHARDVTALNDVLKRYQRRRQAGDVTGPELVALLLYRTKHQVKAWATNLAHPEERVFFAQSETLR